MTVALAYAILYVLAFVFGAVLGDFCNVIVYRVPRKLDWVRGRSMCPHCEHRLSPVDMLPVAGWLLLRGKCRYCGEKISARYPIVEAACGVLAVLTVWVCGLTPAALFTLALCLTLTCVALIDHDTREIPNGTVLTALIFSIGLCFTLPGVTWLSHGIGAVCVSVPFWLLTTVLHKVTGRDAFGGGDIKLLFAMGLGLGWQLELFAVFIALITGAVYALWGMRKGTLGRTSEFAFGPFLSLGGVAALLIGDLAITAYLGLFV